MNGLIASNSQFFHFLNCQIYIVWVFSRKSLGKTFKETLDGRIESIQEELQQFFNPNEVIPEESNEQQRLLRISLRICSTVVEPLPPATSIWFCNGSPCSCSCSCSNLFFVGNTNAHQKKSPFLSGADLINLTVYRMIYAFCSFFKFRFTSLKRRMENLFPISPNFLFFISIGFILTFYFSFGVIYMTMFPGKDPRILPNPLQVIAQLSCFFFFFYFNKKGEVRQRHLCLLMLFCSIEVLSIFRESQFIYYLFFYFSIPFLYAYFL
uniref:ATP synthase protein MI25 n=1 Tax=Sorghum bicolor TaxID=4558 RepID=Q35783_SORBI|nr:hypothetical URF265 [Sorghum bicolor]